MAESNNFDLLCNEETKGFFFDDDFVEPFNEKTSSNGEKDKIFSNGGSMIYLPCLSDECISWMIEREKDNLPRNDYLNKLRSGELDLSLRKEALDWMFKACAHYNFGELCLYSAMSYFDRFLSVYGLPKCSLKKGDKIWEIQLLSVACLSVAAKIEEVNVPATVDLQAGRPEFFFEAKTIQRMEILVLNHLRWKVKTYTPCNFIDYYLRKMNNVEFASELMITKSLQIILRTIEGIEFLEFRPSEIAAAVAVYVSGEMQEMDIDKALSGFVGLEKGRVVKCLELVQSLTPIANFAANSPNGVLEAACLSYKRDGRTVRSCPNSPHNKRRKLDQIPT